MRQVIGDILPVALGVAISPVPIIAVIGGGALSVGETAVAAAVFVVLGSITVAGPVVGYLVAPDRMRGPLDELRTWMTAHNAAVMTVLLLVIGTTILGKGVAGL